MIWTPATEDILMMHSIISAHTGGARDVRDIRLIDSACAAINAGFGGVEVYASPIMKAAGIGCKIIQNHAFVDGNKRTGAGTMLLVCRMNNIELNYTQKELVEIIMKVASGCAQFEDLLLWLTQHKAAGNTTGKRKKGQSFAPKILHFRLKEGTTLETILSTPGVRKANACWIANDATSFISKIFNHPRRNKHDDGFQISINVGFPEDISKWNDEEYVLMLDEAFLQPYTPFHDLKGEGNDTFEPGFQMLNWAIQMYNDFMKTLPFLEVI